MTIANAGFLIQSKPIAWDEPLHRLLEVLQTQPETARAFLPPSIIPEQTVVHLGYHLQRRAGAAPAIATSWNSTTAIG